jgi:hypothetical protein
MKPRCELCRIDEHADTSDGVPQKVVIDDITHIGRKTERKCHTDRITPDMIRDATVSLLIESADEYNTRISRNHALIYPPTFDGGRFQILDLKSLNGIEINGSQIAPNRRIALNNDDKISLAGEAVLRYRDLPPLYEGLDAPCDANQGGESPNHAVMVGHYGGNLRGTTKDVLELKQQLETRRFRGNISALFDSDATNAEILRQFEIKKRVMTKDNLFVFYFSGHGTRKGELALSRNAAEVLSPDEICKALEGFRSKLLLILDGCYTDRLCGDPRLARTAVIGHEGPAYERPCASAPADDQVRSLTTRAIVKALRDNPKRMNVEDLVELVKQDPRVRARNKVVLANHGVQHTQIAFATRPAGVADLPPVNAGGDLRLGVKKKWDKSGEQGSNDTRFGMADAI